MRQFLPPEIAAVKESCEHVVSLGEIKFNATPSLCRTTVERFLPYYREKKEGKLRCKIDYRPYEIAEGVALGSIKGQFPAKPLEYTDKTGIALLDKYQKEFNESYIGGYCVTAEYCYLQ